METVRAFVGCALDAACIRTLASMQFRLRSALEAVGWRASWVRPENMHVTLKFLGDTDTARIAPLSSALARVARTFEPMALVVRGIGSFGDRGGPRVLFACIETGHEPLASLAHAVEDAFELEGIAREGRTFHGHITLARVKYAPHEHRALASLVPEDVAVERCDVLARSVTLFRSDLGRSGAEYHALSEHPLARGTDPAS